LPFLRSDALPKIGWSILSEHLFNGIGITLSIALLTRKIEERKIFTLGVKVK
tara:strand:- start:59974 stop:60129 length:156 start_codon:yes stop_codon:yes gene_type:complete